MSIIRRAAIAALIPATALALAAADADAAPTAVAICRDSNGPRPGGSVYVVHGHRLGCDVVAGQRLHVTRVPNRATCDDMGGKWSANRVCWDVDR
jgi:hypothetical protein